jgi:hypothetical protein
MSRKKETVKMTGRLQVVMALHAFQLARDLKAQKDNMQPLAVSGFEQPYHFQSAEISDALIAELHDFGLGIFDKAAIDMLIKGQLP